MASIRIKRLVPRTRTFLRAGLWLLGIALLAWLPSSRPCDLEQWTTFAQPSVEASSAASSAPVLGRRLLIGAAAQLLLGGARAADAVPPAQTSGTGTTLLSPAALPAMPPNSPEDMFMQWLLGNSGTNSTAGLPGGIGSDGPAPLAALGIGAVVLFTLFSLFKLLVAGFGGLFLYKEFDQQFGKDGRKTGKVIEKTLRRLSGEPVDLLDERRLKVIRLNDEMVSFQASLAEQTSGPGAAAAVRDMARRKRFVSAWQHVLDEIAVTDEQRREVEQAVAKFVKEETDRREELSETRSSWLNSSLQGSLVGASYNRFRLGANLDRSLKLQEELLASIRNALPSDKIAKLEKVLDGEVSLSWLLDVQKLGASTDSAPQIYVLNFDGDPTAAGVALLQQEVTAILGAAKKPREVVLKLKSPGGTVTGYGLAAAQLMRFRDHGVKLVVCVDELAASGGYLMACCADQILCSPFAAIGSIGVISGIPNAAERLEREGFKVVQTTAGKWKRTIDPFQQPTEEALAKAKDDVMMIYKQFAGFVKQNRPGVEIEEVATGEVWFGPDALAKGLVDKLQTSAEYLQQHMAQGVEVLALTYSRKPTGLAGSLAGASSSGEFAEAAEAIGAAADALRAAGVLPRGESPGVLSAASKAMQNALNPGSSWPAGVTEPRMEARGPLGSRGDEYGF